MITTVIALFNFERVSVIGCIVFLNLELIVLYLQIQRSFLGTGNGYAILKLCCTFHLSHSITAQISDVCNSSIFSVTQSWCDAASLSYINKQVIANENSEIHRNSISID